MSQQRPIPVEPVMLQRRPSQSFQPIKILNSSNTITHPSPRSVHTVNAKAPPQIYPIPGSNPGNKSSPSLVPPPPASSDPSANPFLRMLAPPTKEHAAVLAMLQSGQHSGLHSSFTPPLPFPPPPVFPRPSDTLPPTQPPALAPAPPRVPPESMFHAPPPPMFPLPPGSTPLFPPPSQPAPSSLPTHPPHPTATAPPLPHRDAYLDRDARRLAEDPAFDRLSAQVRAQVVNTLAQHSAYRPTPSTNSDSAPMDNNSNVPTPTTTTGKDAEFPPAPSFPGLPAPTPSDLARPHDNFTLALPSLPADISSPPHRSYLPPLLRRALNAIVIDYLRACSYGYSLAVFAAESGERAALERTQRDGGRNAGMGRADVLRCLGVYLSESERQRGGVLGKIVQRVVLLESEEREGWRERDREWLRYMKGQRGLSGASSAVITHSAFGDQVNKMNAALRGGVREDIAMPDRYPRGTGVSISTDTNEAAVVGDGGQAPSSASATAPVVAIALHGRAVRQEDPLEAQARELQREVELEYDSDDELVARPEESLLGVLVGGLTSLPLPRHSCEVGVDTRGIAEYSSGDSLEWRLREIEQRGAARKQEETEGKSRSVEERVQAYMREERERCEKEIHERVELMKRTLINQVRAEERQRFSAELGDIKKNLLEEKEKENRDARERESRLREEFERRERERESAMFRQRQECLSALEAARRREEEALAEKRKHEYATRQADIQLSQERAALGVLRGEVESERRRLEELIDTAKRNALHESETALREERGLRARVEAEVVHLRSVVDDAEAAKASLRERLNDAQQERDVLFARVQELDAAVAARDQRVTSLEGRLQPLLQQMDREVEMRARVIAAEGDAAARRELFELQATHRLEVDSLQRNKDAEISSLCRQAREEREAAQKTETELRSKVKVLHQQVVELLQELELAHSHLGAATLTDAAAGSDRAVPSNGALGGGDGVPNDTVFTTQRRPSTVATHTASTPAAAPTVRGGSIAAPLVEPSDATARAVVISATTAAPSPRPAASVEDKEAVATPTPSTHRPLHEHVAVAAPSMVAPSSPTTRSAGPQSIPQKTTVVTQSTSSTIPQTPQTTQTPDIADSPGVFRIPKARAVPIIPDSPPESEVVQQLRQQAKSLISLADAAESSLHSSRLRDTLSSSERARGAEDALRVLEMVRVEAMHGGYAHLPSRAHQAEVYTGTDAGRGYDAVAMSRQNAFASHTAPPAAPAAVADVVSTPAAPLPTPPAPVTSTSTAAATTRGLAGSSPVKTRPPVVIPPLRHVAHQHVDGAAVSVAGGVGNFRPGEMKVPVDGHSARDGVRAQKGENERDIAIQREDYVLPQPSPRASPSARAATGSTTDTGARAGVLSARTRAALASGVPHASHPAHSSPPTHAVDDASHVSHATYNDALAAPLSARARANLSVVDTNYSSDSIPTDSFSSHDLSSERGYPLPDGSLPRGAFRVDDAVVGVRGTGNEVSYIAESMLTDASAFEHTFTSLDGRRRGRRETEGGEKERLRHTTQVLPVVSAAHAVSDESIPQGNAVDAATAHGTDIASTDAIDAGASAASIASTTKPEEAPPVFPAPTASPSLFQYDYDYDYTYGDTGDADHGGDAGAVYGSTVDGAHGAPATAEAPTSTMAAMSRDAPTVHSLLAPLTTTTSTRAASATPQSRTAAPASDLASGYSALSGFVSPVSTLAPPSSCPAASTATGVEVDAAASATPPAYVRGGSAAEDMYVSESYLATPDTDGMAHPLGYMAPENTATPPSIVDTRTHVHSGVQPDAPGAKYGYYAPSAEVVAASSTGAGSDSGARDSGSGSGSRSGGDSTYLFDNYDYDYDYPVEDTHTAASGGAFAVASTAAPHPTSTTTPPLAPATASPAASPHTYTASYTVLAPVTTAIDAALAVPAAIVTMPPDAEVAIEAADASTSTSVDASTPAVAEASAFEFDYDNYADGEVEAVDAGDAVNDGGVVAVAVGGHANGGAAHVASAGDGTNTDSHRSASDRTSKHTHSLSASSSSLPASRGEHSSHHGITLTGHSTTFLGANVSLLSSIREVTEEEDRDRSFLSFGGVNVDESILMPPAQLAPARAGTVDQPAAVRREAVQASSPAGVGARAAPYDADTGADGVEYMDYDDTATYDPPAIDQDTAVEPHVTISPAHAHAGGGLGMPMSVTPMNSNDGIANAGMTAGVGADTGALNPVGMGPAGIVEASATYDVFEDYHDAYTAAYTAFEEENMVEPEHDTGRNYGAFAGYDGGAGAVGAGVIGTLLTTADAYAPAAHSREGVRVSAALRGDVDDGVAGGTADGITAAGGNGVTGAGDETGAYLPGAGDTYDYGAFADTHMDDTYDAGAVVGDTFPSERASAAVQVDASASTLAANAAPTADGVAEGTPEMVAGEAEGEYEYEFEFE